jgi:hypothetical protein
MRVFSVAKVVFPVVAGCLAGCAGGDEPAAGTAGDGTPSENAAGDTACVVDRTWSADLDDLAGQLADRMSSSGLDVVSAEGEGSQTILFDQDGSVGTSSDLTYTLVVDMGDGLTMRMEQTYLGDPGGTWAWDGTDASGVILFDDFDLDGVTITTRVWINDVESPTSVDLPQSATDDGGLSVECARDSLTTTPLEVAAGAFTTQWSTTD